MVNLRNLPPRYREQAQRQLRSSRPFASPAPVPAPSPRRNVPRPLPVATLPLDASPFGIVSEVTRSDDGNSLRFTIDIDPATFRTAQHKGNKPYIGRDGKAKVHYFTKKAVSDSYKPVVSALTRYRALTLDWKPKDPIAVHAVFFYAYPTSTPKRERIEGYPKVETPDVDNVGKGFFDAITFSHLWHDDAPVYSSHAEKYRTCGKPRVELSVCRYTRPTSARHDAASANAPAPSPSSRTSPSLPQPAKVAAPPLPDAARPQNKV